MYYESHPDLEELCARIRYITLGTIVVSNPHNRSLVFVDTASSFSQIHQDSISESESLFPHDRLGKQPIHRIVVNLPAHAKTGFLNTIVDCQIGSVIKILELEQISRRERVTPLFHEHPIHVYASRTPHGTMINQDSPGCIVMCCYHTGIDTIVSPQGIERAESTDDHEQGSFQRYP